jgi:CheY-like chemotaxis protein
MRSQRQARFNANPEHAGHPVRTVLYVEDHVANALLMHAYCVELPGVRLLVAPTGEAGLQAATLFKLDLLLLDLNLPDCHGSELLERMRLLPGANAIPAVAVTAEEGFHLGSGEAKFQEVWFKPLDRWPTIQRLKSLLDLSNTEPAAHQRSVAMPGDVLVGPFEPPPVTVWRNWTPTGRREGDSEEDIDH